MENIHEADKTGTVKKGRGGRPSTVGASVKTTLLIDPARMEALNRIAAETRRSRNDLFREAVDDFVVKHGEAKSKMKGGTTA